jgi:hypothetical protein
MTVWELARFLMQRFDRFITESPMEEHSFEQRDMLLDFLEALKELEERQREIVKGWEAL